MATTRAAEAVQPFNGVEQTNPSGFKRALSLGMRQDAAILATEHPEYWLYYRVVSPMDFRVAFSRYHDKGESLNAVLTRAGYDVSGIIEPVLEVKDATEAIRPKASNW